MKYVITMKMGAIHIRTLQVGTEEDAVIVSKALKELSVKLWLLSQRRVDDLQEYDQIGSRRIENEAIAEMNLGITTGIREEGL